MDISDTPGNVNGLGGYMKYLLLLKATVVGAVRSRLFGYVSTYLPPTTYSRGGIIILAGHFYSERHGIVI
jgi:hypothetical protein